MRRVLLLLVALGSLAPARAAPRNPLDALRLEDLSVTRTRPLFAPSRRPPPPAPVEAPEPTPEIAKVEPPQPPPFDLIGAVVGERDSYALVRLRAGNTVVRLRPGDETAGWRIGAIGLRSVALERDGRTVWLALTAPSAPLATPAAEVAAEPLDETTPATPPANRTRFAHKSGD